MINYVDVLLNGHYVDLMIDYLLSIKVLFLGENGRNTLNNFAYSHSNFVLRVSLVKGPFEAWRSIQDHIVECYDDESLYLKTMQESEYAQIHLIFLQYYVILP